ASAGLQVFPQTGPVKEPNQGHSGLARFNSVTRVEFHLTDIKRIPIRRSEVVVGTPTGTIDAAASPLSVCYECEGRSYIYPRPFITIEEIVVAEGAHGET